MDIKENKLFLLWTPSYHPRYGGLENSAREYALFIKKKGWKVKVITNRHPYILPKNEVIDGIEVNRYLFLHNPLGYIKSKRFDLFFAWIFIKPLTLFRLIVFFIKNKPKVVNIHFPDNQLIEIILINNFFNFKICTSLHGNEVERLKKTNKNSIKFKLYQKLFNNSEIITFCSDYLKIKLKKIFSFINEDRLMVVNNGVNENFISSKITLKKKKYIFLASRFVPQKGLNIVFNIFSEKNMNGLQIAGGSKKEGEQISQNISHNITFLGVLNRDQIINKLKFTMLTIIPSKKEAYGIIVAEALCIGSPIVTTNVGGIPELVKSVRNKLNKQQQNIFDKWVKLVEPNELSIKNGINSIISNKNSIKEYITLVESFRSQFLWENKLKSLFNRLEKFD